MLTGCIYDRFKEDATWKAFLVWANVELNAQETEVFFSSLTSSPAKCELLGTA
jgi:hypothetical protein